MAVRAIQTRFDGGELSTRLRGRFDSDIYRKALDLCRNCELTPQGSLLLRGGTEHMKKLHGNANTRVLQIRRFDGNDYMIELLNNVMHVYNADGSIIAATHVELVLNGNFGEPNGFQWTKIGADGFFDFPSGTAKLFSSSTRKVLYQSLALSGEARVKFQFKFVGHGNPDDKIVARLRSVQPTGANNDNAGVIYTYTGRPLDGATVVVGDGTLLAAGTYYVELYWTGTIHVSGGGTPPPEYVQFDDVSVIADLTGDTSNIATPWASDELPDVRYFHETAQDRTIFVHPNRAPCALTWSGANPLFGAISFTGAPASWTSLNWPAQVDGHDGRIYYAAEPGKRNRIVASKVFIPDNLTTGSSPSDAIDVNLATKGAIKWIRGGRQILVGTDLGEHSVTGSKGVPAADDIQVRRESAFGGANVQAVDAGSHVIFVSGDRKRVRAINYDLQTSGFESKDVSFTAEHLTSKKVKWIQHCFTPDSLLICGLDDGTMAFSLFEPMEQVVGWYRVELASGFVHSGTTTQTSEGTFLWLVVQRAGNIWLERYCLTDTATRNYLDASVSGMADANGTFAGLTHIADGTTVRAIANGGYVGDFQVITGAIALGPTYAHANVVAGLAYTGTAVTLPKDMKDGKIKAGRLGVILNDSVLPKLNGFRVADRTPSTPMNTPESKVSGKFTSANKLGWDGEGKITIEMDLPFRTEVLALYQSVEGAEI